MDRIRKYVFLKNERNKERQTETIKERRAKYKRRKTDKKKKNEIKI